MRCLSSAQIQAVADGEALSAEQQHAGTCDICGRRVGERQAQIAQLRAGAAVEMPASLAQRIDAALTAGSGASGATRLREQPTTMNWWRPAWGTAAVAAATLIAVLFVAPLLKEDRGGVSAAEVLAASATRLSEAITSGVEILEYELVLDGVPKDLMPDHANGTYRVRQVIDHGTPGRFRFASYAPDGTPFSSIAQDPVSGQRVMMVTVEGQSYRFEVTIPANVGPSIVEMERLHMQATIAMMQASGDQLLETVETVDGRHYRINVPKVQTPVVNPVWDLSEARVLINATDYRVTELDVKGTFLKQPYSVQYRLTNRDIVGNVEPGTFDVPSQPNEILLTGQGSIIPARDAMVLALRELARVKQGR
jgi:hypothetical protein